MTPALLALAGGLPIAASFVLMAGLHWSATRAMAVGWSLAAVLGLVLWRMDPIWLTAAAVYGVLQASEIILIVFGAILLMNTLERSGALATIRHHFQQITRDKRIQVLVIGLGFITVIEGAAGFGTPGALAAPLLIGLGFPPLAAAVFGLFFNALQPPFGAAGTPVIGGIGAVIDQRLLAGNQTVQTFLQEVSGWTGLVTGSMLAFWGLFGVFLLTFWFGPARKHRVGSALKSTWEVAPFALLLGILAGGTQYLVALLFGPALPDIAAGFVVLGVGITLAHHSILVPSEPWTFASREDWPRTWLGGLSPQSLSTGAPAAKMPILLAWTPYLLVALVLLATRWPGTGMVAFLQSYSLDIRQILGQDLSFSLRYLYLPGLVPFIPVAVLTGLLHRMDFASVKSAWRDSGAQVLAPALTLIVAVSMTQIMIQSATNGLGQPGMMQALSRMLAAGAGSAIPFVAPWIGALGAFVTGSSTSSNILFSALQFEAAADAGLSRTIVVALQNVGSGIGNMVSILNIAAVCGVIGISGMEGVILRRIALPTMIAAALAGTAGLVLAMLFAGWY
ncbi:MAG: L-lactate permease [Desulfovibrionales bacterium]